MLVRYFVGRERTVEQTASHCKLRNYVLGLTIFFISKNGLSNEANEYLSEVNAGRSST